MVNGAKIDQHGGGDHAVVVVAFDFTLRRGHAEDNQRKWVGLKDGGRDEKSPDPSHGRTMSP